MCNLSRHYGSTIVGSCRGTTQLTTDAQYAREIQRRVPGYLPHQITNSKGPALHSARAGGNKAVAVGGNSAPQVAGGRGHAPPAPQRSWADVARQATAPASCEIAPGTCGEPEVPPASKHRATEEHEDEEEGTPTILEEPDYDTLKTLITKHDRWLDRRMKCHANEITAIELKKEVV